MNVSWITLRDLEYLTAVAQHLHFGKAAKACHVSQPALSAQIKKMEQTLGYQIFERSNRSVALTEKGRRLVEQAQVVLEEAQKLISVPESEKPSELRGVLRLGVIATLGPYYVPKFLPLLKKRFPDLQLVLREGLTHSLLNELKAGNLDVVLAAPTFDQSSFQVYALFEEPFLLAVPEDHALAQKQAVRTSDLRASDMVLLEDGHCLRDQTLEICPRNRRGNIRQYHVTSLETLRHLVATGMGYTLMPKMAVEGSDSMKGLLKYRRFQDEDVGRTIILVTRPSHPRLPEIELLAEFLRTHAPKL